MVAAGRSLKGEKNPRAILTETSIPEIRRRHVAGESLTDIGKRFNVSHYVIGDVIRRKSWKHVAKKRARFAKNFLGVKIHGR
jgi:hypothetical protein